MKVGYYRSRI